MRFVVRAFVMRVAWSAGRTAECEDSLGGAGSARFDLSAQKALLSTLHASHTACTRTTGPCAPRPGRAASSVLRGEPRYSSRTFPPPRPERIRRVVMVTLIVPSRSQSWTDRSSTGDARQRETHTLITHTYHTHTHTHSSDLLSRGSLEPPQPPGALTQPGGAQWPQRPDALRLRPLS